MKKSQYWYWDHTTELTFRTLFELIFSIIEWLFNYRRIERMQWTRKWQFAMKPLHTQINYIFPHSYLKYHDTPYKWGIPRSRMLSRLSTASIAARHRLKSWLVGQLIPRASVSTRRLSVLVRGRCIIMEREGQEPSIYDGQVIKDFDKDEWPEVDGGSDHCSQQNSNTIHKGATHYPACICSTHIYTHALTHVHTCPHTCTPTNPMKHRVYPFVCKPHCDSHSRT